MKTALLENFLECCKKGIYINFQLKDFKIPSVFIDKFSCVIKANKFLILDELEENEIFIINNLEQCEVKEFDDYLVIHKDRIEIVIEEWI